jgi:hypothetical protein
MEKKMEKKIRKIKKFENLNFGFRGSFFSLSCLVTLMAFKTVNAVDILSAVVTLVILVLIVVKFGGNGGGNGGGGGGGEAKKLRVPLESNIVSDIPDDVVITGIRNNGDGTKDIDILDSDKDSEGKHKVVKFKSQLDGRYYFVCATLPDKQRAADTLAEIHRRSQMLLFYFFEKLDARERIIADDKVDISANIQQMVRKHYNQPMALAEYHAPRDKTVGANSEKGLLIEMCLRAKNDSSKWNSMNTLTRVHIHELAHSGDFLFRADGTNNHGPDFYRIMDHLLQEAEKLGLYSCEEYKASGKAFCGLMLSEEDARCN